MEEAFNILESQLPIRYLHFIIGQITLIGNKNKKVKCAILLMLQVRLFIYVGTKLVPGNLEIGCKVQTFKTTPYPHVLSPCLYILKLS